MRSVGSATLKVCVAALLALGLVELGFFALVESRLFRPNVDGLYALDGNVRFHPLSGYVHTGDTRYVRLRGGRVEADQRYRIDRGDYFSRVNAGRARPLTPGQRRIVVFGDSFTDSTLYLERSWVERSEAVLRAGGREVALLPYAFAGNGLASWHAVYRHWIATNEPFDQAVFVVIYDDLFRAVLAAQGTDAHIYLRRLPASALASANGRPPQALFRCRAIDVVSGSALDHLARIGRGDVRARLDGVRYLAFQARRLFWRMYAHPDCDVLRLTDEESDRLLGELLADLVARGKPIRFALVPEREPLIDYIERQTPPPGAAALADTARRVGAPFFNGYEAFKLAYDRRPDRAVTAEAFVRARWLEHDTHWGQSGSDLFGELFAAFLAEHLG